MYDLSNSVIADDLEQWRSPPPPPKYRDENMRVSILLQRWPKIPLHTLQKWLTPLTLSDLQRSHLNCWKILHGYLENRWINFRESIGFKGRKAVEWILGRSSSISGFKNYSSRALIVTYMAPSRLSIGLYVVRHHKALAEEWALSMMSSWQWH